MHFMTNRILQMHLNANDHGFGTGNTNKLISNLISKQDDIHRENLGSTIALRYSIRELTHYVRWDTKQRSGKEPPPFMEMK